MIITGFHNLNPPGRAISRCMESLGIDEATDKSAPGVVKLAVTGSSFTDEHIIDIASGIPEGQMVWVFSPTARDISHPKLKLSVVTAETEREFLKQIAYLIDKRLKAQPQGAPFNPEHPPFPVTHDIYDSVESFDFKTYGRQTITIHNDGVPFDFYFDPKPETGRLVVLGQDAVTRSKVDLPHFFRWTWSEDINASVLIWSDPTLHLEDTLDGAWWIGSPDRDFVVEGTRILDIVADVWRVETEDILHVGMSAGGFSALQMATLMPGTRALVDIPRVTLQAHGARGATADKAVQACLGFSDAHAVPEEYLPRVDVLSRMQATGNIPEFKYFQNMRDTAHVDSQYRMFRAAIEQHPDYDSARHIFHEYSQWHLSKGGHFPLKRSSMIAEINAMLERSSSQNRTSATAH